MPLKQSMAMYISVSTEDRIVKDNMGAPIRAVFADAGRVLLSQDEEDKPAPVNRQPTINVHGLAIVGIEGASHEVPAIVGAAYNIADMENGEVGIFYNIQEIELDGGERFFVQGVQHKDNRIEIHGLVYV